MLEVVTVFIPLDEYPNWRDYLELLELQKRTAERWGHRHVVVSDTADLPGLNCMKVELPQALMRAQISGQIEYLKRWSGERPFVFVDADCLIGRDLTQAFTGQFDIGLTRRDNAVCPINNGAMYIAAGAKEKALRFYTHALSLCGDHWGGDQEAISQAAAPVPSHEGVEYRGDTRIAFLSMRSHNVTPDKEGARHKRNPFVIHFKGDRKHWMRTYAERFILNEEQRALA